MNPKFNDEVVIKILAGHGGAGSVSFLREKCKPIGPPDGGDGGKGGSVYFAPDDQLSHLNHFDAQRLYEAERGAPGRGVRRHGADGRDLVIRVPPGTIVEDADTNEEICALGRNDAPVLVAQGGMGGKGNEFFKSSTRRSPGFAQRGLEGPGRTIRLRLELIADVGLVGLPNAGKSTLLSRLTAARPKIAAYAFTTISPNLGVLEEAGSGRRLRIADIPGLVENAHKGVGLGLSFLRHIRKTKALVYVIDAAQGELTETYKLLRNELTHYDKSLPKKKAVIALNKMDLEEAVMFADEFQPPAKTKAVRVSGLDGSGLDELAKELFRMVKP